MSPQNGTDWEQDAQMQHLLKRKRRLEELEEYNMPEAMLKKRRAVKEVAQRTPALNISTDLEFDDDIEASDHAEQPSQPRDREGEDDDEADRWAHRSKRSRRRARCAMRRKAIGQSRHNSSSGNNNPSSKARDEELRASGS